MTRIGLRAPERLEVTVAGQAHCGFTQDWYTDEWRRKAGCGPTTATCLLAYCLGRDGKWPIPLTVAEAATYMDRVWEYVTPSYGGLYKTRWMADGLRCWLADAGIERYVPQMLTVSILPGYRPSGPEVIEFIRAGLAADSPVAFLNRHAGKETQIDTWHWVPIVELVRDGVRTTAVCYDEGRRKSFDPAAWTKDTVLGGGFVYLSPTEKKQEM